MARRNEISRLARRPNARTPSGRFASRRPGELERTLVFRAEAINEEARSVDVSFSSQTDEIKFLGFSQILLHEKGAVDLSALTSALLNHDPSQILGRADGARIDEAARVGRATIFFDDDEESERAFKKVLSGSLRGVSLRAKVGQWLVLEDKQTWKSPRGQMFKGPADIAVSWSVREISLTPIPADISVGVGRSEHMEESDMDPKLRKRLEELGLSRDASEEEAWEFLREHQAELAEMERDSESPGDPPPREEDVDDPPADPPPRTEPPAPPADPAAMARAVVREERERVSAIRDLCSRWPEETADLEVTLCSADIPLEEARRRILDRLTQRRAPVPSARRIEIGEEERDKFREGSMYWLLRRSGGLRSSQDAGIQRRLEEARNFECYNLFDFVRMCAQRCGPIIGMSRDAIIARAFSHSSSDFPLILENVLNKILLAAWEEQPVTFRPLARIRSFSDFKQAAVVKLGEAGDLELTPDGVPMPETTVPETGEKYAIDTYTKRISFGRQLIINDDLDALERIPGSLGRAARRRGNRLFWDEFLTNPVIAEDGNVLFHTGHANLSSSSDALTVASLGAARAAMRKQKSFTAPGETARELNIAPTYLVVSPDKETEAEQLIASIVDPAKSNQTPNPFSNRLQIIVEPILTGNAWYLWASPMQITTAEVGFLDGREEPNTVRVEGTNVLGVEFGVYIDTGVKFVEFRGVYKNPGA